uniref:Variant surface glycoprotein 1125.1737 n=1 Tax=Trypanosoma brucei TaxID=5691 RepID=M4TDG1_9TRYP|nr:variant surface glycoprotein 537 [Trypanosoma brucei]APD73878.1 variant surface glycoprotein 1125.1737 [Trypanosoma brucei]
MAAAIKTSIRLVVVSTVLQLQAVQAGPDHTKEENKISDNCKEHEYLTQLGNKLWQAENTATAALTDLKHLKHMWTLHGEAAPTADKQCLLLALAAEAGEKLAELNSRQAAAQAKAKEAQLAIAKHLGMLEMAVEASSYKIADSTTPVNADSSATTAKMSLKIARGNNVGCSLTKAGETNPFADDPLNEQNILNLKLTTASEVVNGLKETTIDIASASSGCPADSGAKTGIKAALGTCNLAGGTTFNFKTPPADTKAAQKSVPVFKEKSRTTSCNDVSVLAAEALSPNQKLANAICEAIKAKTAPENALRSATGETLSSRKTIKTFLRNCVPGFQKTSDIDDTEQSKPLKEYIKRAYGSTSNDFVKNFITKLETENIMSRSEKTPEHKKISDLTTPSSTAATLSYLRGQRNKKELEGAKNTAVGEATDSKKEKDCKAETDETKCNSKDGCEFKDGKCKVKVTTTAETTGNTTGSNSFVLHKPPLWLAFLILA